MLVTLLWHTVSSPWASIEPLFVFWLDIIYNECWLVNLFKWLCYFGHRHTAIHLFPPPQPPHTHTHTPTLVTFFWGVWARVRGYHWVKGSSRGDQVHLHVVCTVFYIACELDAAITFCFFKILKAGQQDGSNSPWLILHLFYVVLTLSCPLSVCLFVLVSPLPSDFLSVLTVCRCEEVVLGLYSYHAA